jgi:transposase
MTMNKNRIRHLLFLNGTALPASDISSPKSRREINHLCISETNRKSIEQCFNFITELKRALADVEKQLEEMSTGIEDVDLLRTIPGVGPIRSVTIYAEIGEINRFRNAKAFARYTGLTPSVRASGEKVHLGDITRAGSRPLRHALVEASITVIRRSPPLRRMFSRVLYRSNIQKARVAVARKMATIIYAMLKHREPFRVQPA